MPKLLILTQAEYFSDPRVLKQSISAVNAGYDTTVYCYTKTDTPEDYDGVKIKRVRYIFIDLYQGMLALFQKEPPKQTKPEIESSEVIVLPTLPQKPKAKLSAFYYMMLSYIHMYLVSNIHLFLEIKNENADIIHATDLPTLFTAILYKWDKGAKVVYDSHEMWVESMDYNPRWLKIASSIWEWFLVKQVNAITTVNYSISKELARRYNIAPPAVVMNCPFYEEVEQNNHTSTFKAIYQGRLVRKRGIEETILSAKYLPANIKVYIRGPDGYGGNYYLNELKRFSKENGVDNRVEFLDPVPMVDLVKALKGFDIGIVPYKPINMGYNFASPNKIFEYLMAGIPVVASDLPEIMKITGCAGVVFKAGDPESMARAIKDVTLDYSRYAEHAKKKSKEVYNWENQVKGLLEIYNNLTSA